MRAFLLMSVGLALCAVARFADAATPGTWFVEASAAHEVGQESAARHVAGSGVAWDASVGRQTMPWLAFTGDIGLLQVDEAFFGVSIPEDHWTIDDATHVTLMTGVRLEEPVRFGLAPSLEFGTGLGWLHWGDRHRTSMNGGGTQTYAGDDDVAWGWSVGLRLGFATPRRSLTPQVTLRSVEFAEQGGPVRMTTFGLGLRY